MLLDVLELLFGLKKGLVSALFRPLGDLKKQKHSILKNILKYFNFDFSKWKPTFLIGQNSLIYS